LLEVEFNSMADKTKYFGKLELSAQKIQKIYELDLFGEHEVVEYVWTKEKEYIKQYSNLINEIYFNEIQVRDAYAKIEEVDLNSKYYMAVIEGNVVAGVRYTVNNPYSENTLPSEKNEINFSKIFEEHELLNYKYCEVTRFAVAESHRNNFKHYINAFRAFRNEMVENNVEYLVICSEKARLKLYNLSARKYFTLIDCKDYDISSLDGYPDIKSQALLYKVKEQD